MSAPLIFPAQHKSSRQKLADWFRQIADHIDRDELVCEPHAVTMCLTGATVHEVVGWGYRNDPEGWNGARQALGAILYAKFRTVGGNIRTRDTRIYGMVTHNKIENLEEHFRLRSDDHTHEPGKDGDE